MRWILSENVKPSTTVSSVWTHQQDGSREAHVIPGRSNCMWGLHEPVLSFCSSCYKHLYLCSCSAHFNSPTPLHSPAPVLSSWCRSFVLPSRVVRLCFLLRVFICQAWRLFILDSLLPFHSFPYSSNLFIAVSIPPVCCLLLCSLQWLFFFFSHLRVRLCSLSLFFSSFLHPPL